MLQLHLSYRQFYCQLRCVLYQRLDGISLISAVCCRSVQFYCHFAMYSNVLAFLLHVYWWIQPNLFVVKTRLLISESQLYWGHVFARLCHIIYIYISLIWDYSESQYYFDGLMQDCSISSALAMDTFHIPESPCLVQWWQYWLLMQRPYMIEVDVQLILLDVFTTLLSILINLFACRYLDQGKT